MTSGRQRRCESLFLLASLASVAFLACNGQTNPTAPGSSRPSISGPAPDVPVTIHGYVTDSAFQPLGGVRIEITNGPDVGQSVISSSSGSFSLIVTGAPTLRATKEGYQAATKAASATVFFQLSPLQASADISGIYRLTLSAAVGCTDIPEEARTRSYTATVVGSGTTFHATLSDATFGTFTGAFHFDIGVAGESVGFYLAGDGAPGLDDDPLIEVLTPTSSVAIGGFGVGVRQNTSIIGSFNGGRPGYQYCPGQLTRPSDTCSVTPVTCQAGGFTFTRQ